MLILSTFSDCFFLEFKGLTICKVMNLASWIGWSSQNTLNFCIFMKLSLFYTEKHYFLWFKIIIIFRNIYIIVSWKIKYVAIRRHTITNCPQYALSDNSFTGIFSESEVAISFWPALTSIVLGSFPLSLASVWA